MRNGCLNESTKVLQFKILLNETDFILNKGFKEILDLTEMHWGYTF